VGLPGDTVASPVPLVIPLPVADPLAGTGTVIIVETDGTTTLKTGVKETDSYTIALSTPPTSRVYITISSAFGGGLPYAEISIDGGVTFSDTVIPPSIVNSLHTQILRAWYSLVLDTAKADHEKLHRFAWFFF